MHFPVACNQYFSHIYYPVERVMRFGAQAYPHVTFVASLKPIKMMRHMAAKTNDADQLLWLINHSVSGDRHCLSKMACAGTSARYSSPTGVIARLH
jgi:hypothetical protein